MRQESQPASQLPEALKGSTNDERAALSPRTTKRHKRFWQKNQLVSLDIPYENFKGSILGGQYRLQHLRHQDDYLDIYSVTSLHGLSFEAQAFSLSELSEKLLQARKRRIKRLLRSKNFVCEIRQAGKRFLIIDLKRNDAEWKNLTNSQISRHVPDWMKDLPDLPPPPTKSQKETDSDTNSVCSSCPPSSLSSLSSCSSYAEVAWKGLQNSLISKTRKGIRQREKRQRKRAHIFAAKTSRADSA